MKVLPFLLVAWVLLGLEVGFAGALQIGHDSGIVPSFVFALVVVVAAWAPHTAALWAALGVGIVKDLVTPLTTIDARGEALIVGPHALGYVLAAQFILAMRGLMNRRNPVTFMVLALAGSIIAQAVVTALLSLRSAYGDPIQWRATSEVVRRFWCSLYTAGAALVLSWALIPLAGYFGFQIGQQRRFVKRY